MSKGRGAPAPGSIGLAERGLRARRAREAHRAGECELDPKTVLERLREAMSVFGITIEQPQIVLIKGGTSKHDALDQLIDAVAQNPAIADKQAFRHAVHERESVMSTGIGGGIAIPHVRIPEVRTPTVGVGIAPKGLDFGTLDNRPVYILVLFATPAGADKEYLGLLAQVMMALRNRTLYDRLVTCRNAAEAYTVLNE